MSLAESNDAARRSGKSAAAFRTISEVATDLDVPPHVLRFWESKFPQIKPLKRGGGRRYYRPEDVDLLRRIRELLYRDGYTIKGVQKLLRTPGVRSGDDHEDASDDLALHEHDGHDTDGHADEMADHGAEDGHELAAAPAHATQPGTALPLATLALATLDLRRPLEPEARALVEEVIGELATIRDSLIRSPGRLAE